jgi:hypothetical protein
LVCLLVGATSAGRKYSLAKYSGAKKTVESGNPDQEHISTSYVEGQNLTMSAHEKIHPPDTSLFKED